MAQRLLKKSKKRATAKYHRMVKTKKSRDTAFARKIKARGAAGGGGGAACLEQKIRRIHDRTLPYIRDDYPQRHHEMYNKPTHTRGRRKHATTNTFCSFATHTTGSWFAVGVIHLARPVLDVLLGALVLTVLGHLQCTVPAARHCSTKPGRKAKQETRLSRSNQKSGRDQSAKTPTAPGKATGQKRVRTHIRRRGRGERTETVDVSGRTSRGRA